MHLNTCLPKNSPDNTMESIAYIINSQGPGGRFKNTYELLNLRALKISPVNKIHIFQCMGKIFCVEFEIPHKISYSYIERYDFYTILEF